MDQSDTVKLEEYIWKHLLKKIQLPICLFLNPILVGGIFTLGAIYRVKSPQSRGKLGGMVYLNTSWDIYDRT